MSEKALELVQPNLLDLIETHGGSLTFKKDPTFEQWLPVTQDLFRNAKNAMWIAGDAFKYGEKRWEEKAYQAIPDDAQDVELIKRAAYVCGIIPPNERIATLSFTHHAEVVGLEPEDRKEILQKAASEHLPVKKVRALVREKNKASPKKTKRLKQKEKTSVEVSISDESTIIEGMDLAIAYILRIEKEEKTAQWPANRKSAWAKRLLEFRRISRRMKVIA